jgi:tetratricopeptide (TPR) repeat protein
LESPKFKAMRKSNLGAIYLYLNKNQESLRNYTQALKIYNESGECELNLMNTYYNVGNIYLREGMYEVA